jgi:hypothetical protein
LVANDHSSCLNILFFYTLYSIKSMSNIPDNNLLMNSQTTNTFLHACIEIAIDGFLFRGVKPSDHLYRFSQSFPKALTLSSNSLSTKITSKQSHISSKSSDHNNQQRINNIPSLDLSSLDSNRIAEQQRTLTIKTKKPVYSPKDVRFNVLFALEKNKNNFLILVDFIFRSPSDKNGGFFILIK